MFALHEQIAGAILYTIFLYVLILSFIRLIT